MSDGRSDGRIFFSMHISSHRGQYMDKNISTFMTRFLFCWPTLQAPELEKSVGEGTGAILTKNLRKKLVLVWRLANNNNSCDTIVVTINYK